MSMAVSAERVDTKKSMKENGKQKPFSLPHSFGRYLLFEEIGAGGMARIYLSQAKTQLGVGQLVVVKQIHPELSVKEKFSQMFIEEAKLSARLGHPNIVQVFGLGKEESRLFIAMEYVEGYDLNILLRKISKSKVALPAEFALLMIQEILKGLEYAHQSMDDEGEPLEIVHRDLSPSNILISFEGEVKLCDFGIAKAVRSAATRSDDVSTGFRVAGKSAYMAPEHARGEQVDTRADLFAVGILLWELCAGRRMYRGSEKEMLSQAQQAEVPCFPDRNLPELPMLRQLLEKALHPSKEDRFQTASEFLIEIERYMRAAGLVASPLKFGQFLKKHFGEEIQAREKKLELALQHMKTLESMESGLLEIEDLEVFELEEDEDLVSQIRDVSPNHCQEEEDLENLHRLALKPKIWKYVAIVGWVVVLGLGSIWLLNS